jgi:hypothetical protein
MLSGFIWIMITGFILIVSIWVTALPQCGSHYWLGCLLCSAAVTSVQLSHTKNALVPLLQWAHLYAGL